MAHEIHLELLLGRKVLDAHGQSLGRIEEIGVERQGSDWIVTEYLTGMFGLFERLGVRWIPVFLGVPLPPRRGYRVPWDQLDLSDPEHPRLRGSIEDVRAIHEKPPSREPRKRAASQ